MLSTMETYIVINLLTKPFTVILLVKVENLHSDSTCNNRKPTIVIGLLTVETLRNDDSCDNRKPTQ